MTCPAETSLLLYAEGLETLDRNHLDSCSGCREAVEQLEAAIGELRAARPSASEVTAERLDRVRPPASAHAPRRLFFAAAAATLLAITALALFRPGERAPAVKEPSVKIDVPDRKPAAPRTETDEMIRGALDWLAKNQRADGSFGNAGLTGLAALAWLGAGHADTSPEYGRALRMALNALHSNQTPDGNLAAGVEARPMYAHAIAAWALVEACGGKSTDARDRVAADRAIAFLLAAQNPKKGWRYTSRCGDNDMSVTFWAGSALAVARKRGFDVPEAAFDGMRDWIREITDPASGSVGYNARGTGKVYVPGMNENYRHHPAMTAGAMALRLLAGDVRDGLMAAAIGHLVSDPPSAKEATDVDYYYWHLGSLGLYLHDGPSVNWAGWNERLLEALRVKHAADGSWEPDDRWGKDESAGRAYATAINALSLETALRVAPPK